MKIKLAIAAIVIPALGTVTALGVIAGTSDPDAGPLDTDPCKIASAQSPTWDRWIVEATRDDGLSGDPLTQFCKSLLTSDNPDTEEV